MKNILYFVGLFLLFAAAKCEKDPTYELDQSFQLQPGNSVVCNCKDKLEVQFAGIKEDSRCPKNVNCFWAGQVTAALTVDGQAVELTLGSREKGKSSQVVNGYTIELQQVNPYPVDGDKIAKGDYTVGLIVKGKP